jgi:hypothetical protein
LLSPTYIHQNKKFDASYQKCIQDELLIYSPYCVPQLQEALNSKDHREVMVDIIEILGLIADKERAARIGYVRDTSSVNLVIDQMDPELKAPVKVALLKIIGKFFDVLSQPQKDKLEKAILAQLAHADAGVLVQAALTLLELFPKQQAAVQAALAKPDFADESARKMMAEALAKAKEKSH